MTPKAKNSMTVLRAQQKVLAEEMATGAPVLVRQTDETVTVSPAIKSRHRMRWAKAQVKRNVKKHAVAMKLLA